MGFIKFKYIVMIISRFEHRYDSYHFSVTGGKVSFFFFEDRGGVGRYRYQFCSFIGGHMQDLMGRGAVV